MLTLCEKNFAVHRAHTRKVKDFIRSLGNGAKTDKLDAKNLSFYGFERGNGLERFTVCSQNAEKKKVLKTIPGIGDLIANDLLVLLPELGRLSRRQIASLVGLAPIAKDSSKLKGYRRTHHGREGIKSMLFLAAMAALTSAALPRACSIDKSG